MRLIKTEFKKVNNEEIYLLSMPHYKVHKNA